jgi:Protein of unknown function (DUF3179)
VNNQVYHFGAIGLTNGLAVLADRETRTHWDHITGEAVAGPLRGYQLDVWPIRMSTVAAALAEHPDITISFSESRSLGRRLAQRLYPHFIHDQVWLPGFFYASMSEPFDPRLDKLTQGLGVIVGKKAKYYPLSRIPAGGTRDDWHTRVLYIERGAIDGVPRATWLDTGEEPMQLLSRWYGFSFTYPGCEIYEPPRFNALS